MTSFNFTKHAPAKTARYTFPVSPSIGALIVRYAGQSNKAYTDHLAKLTAKTGAARRIARGQVTADLLRENLNMDRRLFPRHVIQSWEGVTDASGAPVEFSLPNCEAFLQALPDWLMQDLSQFCGNPVNFTDDEEIEADELDFEDTAGN